MGYYLEIKRMQVEIMEYPLDIVYYYLDINGIQVGTMRYQWNITGQTSLLWLTSCLSMFGVWCYQSAKKHQTIHGCWLINVYNMTYMDLTGLFHNTTQQQV